MDSNLFDKVSKFYEQQALKIEKAYKNIPIGIINTAVYHNEGTNVVLNILIRVTDVEKDTILFWLKENTNCKLI